MPNSVKMVSSEQLVQQFISLPCLPNTAVELLWTNSTTTISSLKQDRITDCSTCSSGQFPVFQWPYAKVMLRNKQHACSQCSTNSTTVQAEEHQPKFKQNSSLPATLLDLASRASASSVEKCARGHVTTRHNHTLGPALKWAMLSPSPLLQKSPNHTQCPHSI